ncbi:MAG: hypothetical protein V4550_09465 [Gemmatimonadota bacterium]
MGSSVHCVAVLLAAAITACGAPKPSRDTGGAATDSSAQSRIAALEVEARALARLDGCASANECRSAPVGERACGGPRTYIVYCAATTDSVALFRKLEELRLLEVAANTSSNAMSTCEFRLPPIPGFEAKRCRAPTP